MMRKTADKLDRRNTKNPDIGLEHHKDDSKHKAMEGPDLQGHGK
jgi:hypothetical protein